MIRLGTAFPELFPEGQGPSKRPVVNMATRSTSLDEDLSCPVCCDTFREPVVLRCSHSFCKPCLDTYWRDKTVLDCPVCRRRSSTDSPPINLALRNIVESYLRDQRVEEQKKPVVAPRGIERGNRGAAKSQAAGDSGPHCGLHGEKLLLYCVVDQEPICVVCQASRNHRNHQLSPVDEAALDLKEEVRTSLRPLKEKLETFNKVKQQCVKMAEHIQAQARKTEDQIKKEFEKLHHFLWVEEASRISALMNETERKSMIMKEKIDHLTKKMASLSDTIKSIEKEIQAEDVSFLQAYRYMKERAQCKLQAPELVSGALINVAEHLGNLKFRVWEKMQEMVQYSPVTLDPNTAAPWLSLSDDLISVQYQGEQMHIPDNPERCDLCVCVLGAEGFTSGRHSWEVEVGNKTKWDLGVMKESIQRKGVLSVNPSQGFWAIALRDGRRYSACTQPWTPLTLKRKPQKIRVLLDYDNSLVSFFDHGDMSLIYTFRGSFTERLFPYFSPCVSDKGQNVEPLKICPAKVSVVMM
ncbi:zinc-binding protein A33-like [Megalops cyprinoides]|uniref:zinc-binding protein A33-like n=1 Tax=Megalops cyprinoides TaxID=118141 RepID=UPI00186432A7|nr:zinc-binding protein A33-like [Megalops cyprinoides]